MEFKFKESAEPCGSSSGFWYDLTSGGYIKPEDLLDDADQIEKVNNAIELLQSFEEALEEAELLQEF